MPDWPHSPTHHQRKCFICHHPDRETIEETFVHWHSPSSIYRRFMLRDRFTIYDHAHATGLFANRRRNLRYALENMIERVDECDISAHGIVAAIKAYASLTTSGEWIEPGRRIIYTSVFISRPVLSKHRTQIPHLRRTHPPRRRPARYKPQRTAPRRRRT